MLQAFWLVKLASSISEKTYHMRVLRKTHKWSTKKNNADRDSVHNERSLGNS